MKNFYIAVRHGLREFVALYTKLREHDKWVADIARQLKAKP